MKWTLIAQGGDDQDSLDETLRASCSDPNLDRLDVAVAYATLQGVKALKMALNGIPQRSRWIIGLDDGISQPAAIEYLMKLNGAKVRLAKLSPSRRFHPKLYCIWSSVADDICISAVGSGNMTLNGLRKNGETGVVLSADCKEEADKLKAQWKAMWRLGVEATIASVSEYKAIYEAAKIYRKKIADAGASPPEPEQDDPVEILASYTGDPSGARTAWLEAGSPSAGGRDLEFPKAMMPFFALSGGREDRKITTVGGSAFILTFTERLDNQMWRLLFSSSAIQAAIGRDSMRPAPGINRSDLVVVFHKVAGSKNLRVEFTKIGSTKHIQLQSESKLANGLYRTRNPGGREFGFI